MHSLSCSYAHRGVAVIIIGLKFDPFQPANAHMRLIYRRIPRLRPPPFCMLALGKSGEGAYTRDRDISA